MLLSSLFQREWLLENVFAFGDKFHVGLVYRLLELVQQVKLLSSLTFLYPGIDESRGLVQCYCNWPKSWQHT